MACSLLDNKMLFDMPAQVGHTTECVTDSPYEVSSMSERRQHPRYDSFAETQVSLGTPTSPSEPVTATLLNVSATGVALQIYVPENSVGLIRWPLTDGQMVQLHVVLPTTGDTIRSAASVRWYLRERCDASGHYLKAGLMLLEMPPEDNAKWRKFVEDTAQIASQDTPG
jgi:hypothetical protein